MRCVCECDCVYSRPILPEGKLIQSANNKQCITCRIPLTMAKCIRSTYCVCERVYAAVYFVTSSSINSEFLNTQKFYSALHFFPFLSVSSFQSLRSHFHFHSEAFCSCGLMVFLDCVWFYFFSSLQLSFVHLTKLIYTKESARQRQCLQRKCEGMKT